MTTIDYGWAEWFWAEHPDRDPRRKTLDSYVVTSTANSGPGTLRDALSRSGRRITFDRTMTIGLTAPIVTPADNLIIDGANRVTIKRFAVKFEGTGIIVNRIKFVDALGSPTEDCLTFRSRVGAAIQAFRVAGCSFQHAGDGGLDIIWNRGRDVYGTVAHNLFEQIDKTCLVDSGETSTEGGRYHVTFTGNVWSDCYQRMPMARNADIHIVGDRYVDFGEPDGGGGGAKSARGCTLLAVDVVAEPRTVGETTFDGSTVTKPRMEAVGPHMSTPTGAVRCVNCPPAHVKERDPSTVPDPPYMTP